MDKKVGPGSCLRIVVGVMLLLALLVYLCMPYSPRTAIELYGDYVLDCELVHEELTLRPDGTFTQTVTIKATSEVFSSKGKWTYHRRMSYGLMFGRVRCDGGYRSVLKWPNELKPDYAHRQPGSTSLPAEYWFGQLVMGGGDSWPEWKKVE